MRIAFTVLGKAQPAGSKKAFAFRRSNGALGATVTDANPNAKAWKQEVASAAREAFQGHLLGGALRVCFTFYRPRPLGHFKKSGGLNSAGLEAVHPTTKPDVLKLARGAEDALTGVVWRDDAQIVDERLVKAWGEPARMEVVIETV